MKHLSSYFKTRLPLIITAFFVSLLFMPGNKNKSKRERTVKLPPSLVEKHTSKQEKSDNAKTSSPRKAKNKKPKICVIEFKKSYLPDIPFLIFDKLKIQINDASLKNYEDATAAAGSANLKNVENFHITGEIYLFRAKLLAKIIANPSYKDKIKPAPSFEIASSPELMKKQMIKFAKKAVRYLSFVRPLPKYALWSKALYEKAEALNLLQKFPQAVATLKIVARTRSQSEAAVYSRLSLGLFYFNQRNYKTALKYFKKITKTAPAEQKIFEYMKETASKFAASSSSKETASDFAASLKTTDPLIKLKIRDLAYFCGLNGDFECISAASAKLDAKLNQSFFAWIYKIFKDSGKTKDLRTVCRLYKGLKK